MSDEVSSEEDPEQLGQFVRELIDASPLLSLALATIIVIELVKWVPDLTIGQIPLFWLRLYVDIAWTLALVGLLAALVWLNSRPRS